MMNKNDDNEENDEINNNNNDRNDLNDEKENFNLNDFKSTYKTINDFNKFNLNTGVNSSNSNNSNNNKQIVYNIESLVTTTPTITPSASSTSNNNDSIMHLNNLNSNFIESKSNILNDDDYDDDNLSNINNNLYDDDEIKHKMNIINDENIVISSKIASSSNTMATNNSNDDNLIVLFNDDDDICDNKLYNDDYIDEDFDINSITSTNTNTNINASNQNDIDQDDNDDDDVNCNEEDNVYEKKEFIIDDDENNVTTTPEIEKIEDETREITIEKLVDDDEENINKEDLVDTSITVTPLPTSTTSSTINSKTTVLSNTKTTSFYYYCNQQLKVESMSSIEDNTCEEARLWSDTDALLNQIPQVESSSCGKIAIINVLKALKYEFDYDHLNSNIKFNRRNESGTLAQYLFSRSVAGMNAIELIENVKLVTNNKIIGRFFSFYPQRDVNILQWLSYWIKKGAVPVALLNLQRVSLWGFVPDAWHHQMIYGCGSDGVYLTNPIERKSSEMIMKELTSDSILLVRSIDVLKRFNPNDKNLIEIIRHGDKRWHNLNVLGQVINVLREYKYNDDYSSNRYGRVSTSTTTNTTTSATTTGTSSTNSSSGVNNLLTHIEIPASYVPGITFFVYKESALCKELFDVNELPFK